MSTDILSPPVKITELEQLLSEVVPCRGFVTHPCGQEALLNTWARGNFSGYDRVVDIGWQHCLGCGRIARDYQARHQLIHAPAVWKGQEWTFSGYVISVTPL